MKKIIKHTGQPIKINYEKQEITYNFSFVDPEIFAAIENIIKEGSYHEIKIKYINNNPVSDNKIACWYASISTILKFRGIIPNVETVKALDKNLRESIFPVKYINVGFDQLVPDVPRIHDLSDEEFGQCINTLHERHSYIDWEQFKL